MQKSLCPACEPLKINIPLEHAKYLEFIALRCKKVQAEFECEIKGDESPG